MDMPPITREAALAAIELKIQNVELYSGTDFDRYVAVASANFSDYDDPDMTKSYFNLFYTTIKNSGDVPDLSYKSLCRAQMELFEEFTGLTREEAMRYERVYWNQGLAESLDDIHIDFSEKNPEYLGVMGKMSLLIKLRGGSTVLPFMIGLVVYKAMEIELEKQGRDEKPPESEI